MEHPITPTPELVRQWVTEAHHQDYCSPAKHIATQAARWGADQELEACCEWIQIKPITLYADVLRAARRANPPSLKEQALAALAAADGADHPVVCIVITADQHAIIRRALETLDE